MWSDHWSAERTDIVGPDVELRVGRRIKEFLDDPVIGAEVRAFERRIFEAWESTKHDELSKREVQYAVLRGVRELEHFLAGRADWLLKAPNPLTNPTENV